MTDAERATLDQCLAVNAGRLRQLVDASPHDRAEFLDEFDRSIALLRARYDPRDDGPIRCAVCRWPYGIVYDRGRVQYIDILLLKDCGSVDFDAPEHHCPVTASDPPAP